MGKKFVSRFLGLTKKHTFKLFLIVILCSSVFTGMSISLQVLMSYWDKTARVEDNVKFIESSYLPSIADSLYKLDGPSLQLLLRGTLQLEGIRYCKVSETLGSTGFVVSEGDIEARKDIVREIPLLYHTQKGETLDIGILTVVAEFEGLFTHIWRNTSWAILINAIQIFATAFVVLIIFHRMISRHLIVMAGYAKKLNIDNLEPALKLNRQPVADELTLVVDAINDLRERLSADIALRKRQEIELRHLNERFGIVVDSLDAGVYVADMETYELLFINRYLRERWGNIAGEICWKKLQPNQIGPCSFCSNKKLVNGDGNPSGIYLWENQNPFNNRWYECRDQAIKWVDGRIVRLEVATDITDRKKIEEEKVKLQSQLQQSQKMEAIGTLAGGIAHDFNNILSAIIGYAELSKMTLYQNSEMTNYMEEILKAGNRAKDLVKQILTFSRQTDQERKPVSLKLIVKEVLKLIRASLPSTIEIRHQIKSESLVMGDPTQIHQILMNLCTNAGHAMLENGGLLEVELDDMELDAKLAHRYQNLIPGKYIKLTVSDTGCGIPLEIQERIFEPFYTTKAQNEGTGMGLAVVHGIVKSSGGTVQVFSERGEGASFKVFLPAVEQTLAPEEIPETLPEGKEHILFVDDEPALIDIGKGMLNNLGYNVTARTNPIEALELFRARPERFDLLITDMTMPNMTGEKLAREIISLRPDLPAILCTGFSAGMTEEKATRMGINGYLMKPIILFEMAKLVRKLLDENKSNLKQ